MTLNVTGLIQCFLHNNDVGKISTLLRLISAPANGTGFVFDGASITQIHSIPRIIPGEEIQSLVDIALLHLFSVQLNMGLAKYGIIANVLETRDVDIMLAYLDCIANEDVLFASRFGFDPYGRVCTRTDIDLIQLQQILCKLWSVGYVPNSSLFLSKPLYIDRVEDITRRLVALPEFPTKMNSFMDLVFTDVCMRPKLLHAICRGGFVPSAECVISLLLCKSKKSVVSIRIILQYYPHMISIFYQIESILIRLIRAYQADEFVELRMLYSLKSSALDYVFVESTGFSVTIYGTQLKLYGPQFDLVLKYFFKYYLYDYRIDGAVYESPIFSRMINGKQGISRINKFRAAATVRKLSCYLRICQGVKASA